MKTQNTTTGAGTSAAQHVKEYRAEDAKEVLQEEQEEATLVHLTDRAFLKLKALEGYEEERPEDV
jgi:hypothetical protein